MVSVVAPMRTDFTVPVESPFRLEKMGKYCSVVRECLIQHSNAPNKGMSITGKEILPRPEKNIALLPLTPTRSKRTPLVMVPSRIPTLSLAVLPVTSSRGQYAIGPSLMIRDWYAETPPPARDLARRIFFFFSNIA